MIRRRSYWLAVLPVLTCAGALYAQQYPVMDMVSDELMQKYQSATCETLWQQKQAPKSERQKEMIQLLRDDPQMRAAFLNKVAAPIVNKMFECGMVP